MKISTLLYTIVQGFRNIFRNKLFSLASIATISACLFLFGIFYSIIANFQSTVLSAQEGIAISAFIYDEVSDVRLREIIGIIERRTEVSKVVYLSEEEAFERFAKQRGEGFKDGFRDNPFANRDMRNLLIQLADVDGHSALRTYLASMPEIRILYDVSTIAGALSGVNLLISYVSAGIIAILLAVSIFLISNTVMIGISVRREEINIMKYIGATDFFVRAPFVLEGMLIGFIGAFLPLGLLRFIYDHALEYVTERFDMLSNLLNFVPAEEIFRFLTPLSMVVGVGIGLFGSVITVKKHLHV